MTPCRTALGVGYHSADVPSHPSRVVSRPPLRVAVLGAGTVGNEVVRALLDRREALSPVGGTALQLTGVAVRDVDAAIARGVPRELVRHISSPMTRPMSSWS